MWSQYPRNGIWAPGPSLPVPASLPGFTGFCLLTEAIRPAVDEPGGGLLHGHPTGSPQVCRPPSPPPPHRGPGYLAGTTEFDSISKARGPWEALRPSNLLTFWLILVDFGLIPRPSCTSRTDYYI